VPECYAGDPTVRMEFNAGNVGTPFKQWNKGLGLARGSDDYADKTFLERLVGVLNADEAITLAYYHSWCVEVPQYLSNAAILEKPKIS
jgi:hypothetical protein